MGNMGMHFRIRPRSSERRYTDDTPVKAGGQWAGIAFDGERGMRWAAFMLVLAGCSSQVEPERVPPDPGAVLRYEGVVDTGPVPVRPTVKVEDVPLVEACGAPTRKGVSCRRRVVGGGRCWQHR